MDVLADVEVDLGHRPEPHLPVHVDELCDLRPVSGCPWKALEQGARCGYLTGERLAAGGELGIEDLEKGARRELGHPAAALRRDGGAALERAPVEALDVLHAVLEEQGQERIEEVPFARFHQRDRGRGHQEGCGMLA